MRNARSLSACFAGLAATLIATSTTHAHAGSQIPLPFPACGVAGWAATGGGHSSYTPNREGQTWDGGPERPMPGDAPLAPERAATEPPANPAEGTPLVLVGGAAALGGGVWATVVLAGSDGDESLDGLFGAVPLTAIGLVMVGIGVAKWSGPSRWEREGQAAATEPGLTISSRGWGIGF